MVPRTHTSQSQSGISISLAVFAQLSRVPYTDRQTHRQRYVRHLHQQAVSYALSYAGDAA